jgi:hypothetical protein
MQRPMVKEIRFFRNVPCWLWSFLTTVLVLLPRLLTAAPSPDSASRAFPAVLTLQDGKLTAHISSLPLHQVMEEVSRLSGAEVLWLGQEEEEQISAEFSAIPLAEALRQLLGEKNFMLFYVGAGQETRLAQIWISSHIPTVAQSVLAAQPAPPTADDLAPPDVLQTVLYGPDSSARAQAVQRLQGYQKDPRVKRILSQVAQNDTDPGVQQVASSLLAAMP